VPPGHGSSWDTVFVDLASAPALVGLEYMIVGLNCGFMVTGSITLRSDTRW
jgi:hypothetical protein